MGRTAGIRHGQAMQTSIVTTITAATPTRRPTGIGAAALVLAPVLWLAGWIIMRLRTQPGPGLAWTSAHLIWVAAFVGFGLALVALARWAVPRTTADRVVRAVGVGVGLVGTAAMLGQMAIDLTVGLRAADRAEMSALSDQFSSYPGVDLVFFILAPPLLYSGLLIVLTLLAAQRRITPWPALLVVLGVVLIVTGRGLAGFRLLEGLGAVSMWFALAPLARRRD
jgi:hypothetical protein